MITDDFRAVRAALAAHPGTNTPGVAALTNLGIAEASGILIALRTGGAARSDVGAGFYLRWWPERATLRAVA